MNKKRKRRIFDIIRILILLAAFSVVLYPTVSEYLYEKNSTRVISKYDAESVRLSREEQQKMLDDAEAYNRELVGKAEPVDAFSADTKETERRYQELLKLDSSGMMGYIKIPKINVQLPIYHGTSEAVLQAGAGHLEGTSLPVGGADTHTVISGHRGLKSKNLFTDLDQMTVGDIFYLKVLNVTLAYEVDQVLTVLPEETEALRIEPGKDLATLVTCTPYAVNTHRLLVRGHRIPYEEAAAKQNSREHAGLSFQMKMLLSTVGIIAFIFLITILIMKKQEKNRYAKS